jgi:hypothetical protein
MQQLLVYVDKIILGRMFHFSKYIIAEIVNNNNKMNNNKIYY